MIIAKIFKMIVLKGMIKIIFYSPKFFKTGSINEMLFWANLLFLKGISKAICDLVLYVFLERTKSSLTWNGEEPFQYLKIFVERRCSAFFFFFFFFGRQFISLYSLAPICYLELSFKQKPSYGKQISTCFLSKTNSNFDLANFWSFLI